MNRFILNETSYHGAGAIKEIASEVKARGFEKCFVCSDPDLIKFGLTKKVTDVLDGANISYHIFSEIKANPTKKVEKKVVEEKVKEDIGKRYNDNTDLQKVIDISFCVWYNVFRCFILLYNDYYYRKVYARVNIVQ